MNLALNNLQRLISHKIQLTNQLQSEEEKKQYIQCNEKKEGEKSTPWTKKKEKKQCKK